MTAPALVNAIRVLLIEDNPGDARLLVEMLTEVQAGMFEVERANRLAPALERLERSGVDIVLLDLGLPDSHGLDTFLRTQRGTVGEPIVVISGTDDESLALEAVRSGAQDYLVKGRIDGELLARVIRYAIERTRTAAALSASESHYRTILENVADAVFVTDLTGNYLDVNPQACVLTGYSRAELLKLGVADTYAPEDRGAAARRIAAVVAGDTTPFARRMQRKDGSIILIEGSATLLPNGQGLSTFRDITQRTQAEGRIRESEQRFRELAENVREVFFIVDPTTGIAQYVNPAYEQIFGHSMEHAYTTPYAWIECVHPDDRDAALASERKTSETGESRPIVFRIVRPDNSIRWIRGHATPVRNAAGEITRIVGVAEDITDLKHTEAQFHQAQKMEAVGQLAAGVAHDFNNLLTVITLYGTLQVSNFEPGNATRADLEEIVSAAQRATELTKQLLAFSRQQVLEPRVLDLNVLVRNVSKMLRRLIGEEIDLVAILSDALGAVRADPGEVEQILMNLVVNARDAMPNGGKLTIETANVELSEAYTKAHEALAPGAYILLAVSDTGEGMDEATVARIFEPFFTTKERGKGTGLGLSTVYGIVKQSGGYILVYSEAGRGTAFKVYFPRVSDPAEAIASGDDLAEIRGGNETILLVEDEISVRKGTRAALERLGYAVIDADRPVAAIALMDVLPYAPDIIVTDVVLPGSSGRDLARALEAKWPGLKVLYLSGYTDAAIVRHGVLEPGVAFLQKPFTPDALARKVRQVLDAPPPGA